VASYSVVLCNLWIVSGYFRSFRDARPSGTGMDKLNCCRQTTIAQFSCPPACFRKFRLQRSANRVAVASMKVALAGAFGT
jgi:hypothetical protein